MLVLRLCQWLREELSIVLVTNDIHTREDAEFLARKEALAPGRILGGRPAVARTQPFDDTSMNLAAIAELRMIKGPCMA